MPFIFEYFPYVLVFAIGFCIGSLFITKKLGKEARKLQEILKDVNQWRQDLDAREERIKTQERRSRSTGHLHFER